MLALLRLRWVSGKEILSFYLLIIAMESLNNIFKTTNFYGWRKGFEVARVGSDSLEVTHLQYVDDTLIFCDADRNQSRHLRIILLLFEGISGLHINWGKNFLYPINDIPCMNMLSSILGGAVGSLPTIYLGMPLGASQSRLRFGILLVRNVKRIDKDGRPNTRQEEVDRL